MILERLGSIRQLRFCPSFQIFGIICTLAAERILSAYPEDDRVANGALAIVLLLGTILTALIKPDYR